MYTDIYIYIHMYVDMYIMSNLYTDIVSFRFLAFGACLPWHKY